MTSLAQRTLNRCHCRPSCSKAQPYIDGIHSYQNIFEKYRQQMELSLRTASIEVPCSFCPILLHHRRKGMVSVQPSLQLLQCFVLSCTDHHGGHLHAALGAFSCAGIVSGRRPDRCVTVAAMPLPAAVVIFIPLTGTAPDIRRVRLLWTCLVRSHRVPLT